jgi:O-antigen ligase
VGAITLVSRWWQYLGVAIAVMAGLYASLLSMTRGAWLLIPVVAMLWLWLYRRDISKKGWVAIGSAFLVIVVIGSVWMPQQLVKGIESGMSDLKSYQEHSNSQTSWGARLNMWHDSITFFKQHPILGIGIGDFKVERQRLMDEGKANKGWTYGHAHSIYFHALATTGLVGFVTLVVCIIILPFTAMHRLWRLAANGTERFYVLGGLTVVTAFSVFGLSEGWLVRNPFMNEYLLLSAFFMVSAYSLLSHKKGPQQASP